MKRFSFLSVSAVLFLLLATSLLQAQPGQQMGRLRVLLAPESTITSAQIFINGQAKGMIYRGRASEFILPFSRQATVRLVHGTTVVEQRIALTPGRWVNVSIPVITAVKGSIRVHLDAGPDTAQVYVANVFRGVVNRGSFIDIPELDIGNHQVRVQGGNSQQQTTAKVVSGQMATVRVRLQAEPQEGRVRLTLDSSSEVARANVFIDGRRRGRVSKGQSLVLRLPAGRHTVRVSDSDLSQERVLNIPNGSIINTSFVLQKPKGWLQFRLERSSDFQAAQLEIDDASRGRVISGQTYNWELPAGQHTVRVYQNKAEQSATITVSAGRTTPLALTLRQPKGNLAITHSEDSSVQLASLYLNGTLYGTLARGATITLKLDAGNYTAQLRNGNFESDPVSLNLAAGETLPARLTVIRPKGVVNLTYSSESAYAWANVYIDGQQSGRIRRGQTRQYEVEAGNHSFEVRAENEARQQQIPVRRNQTRNLTLKLESSTGRLAVTLAGNSSVASAQLMVNGQNRGMINRGQTLHIDDLAPGTASVVMTANGMSEQAQTRINRGQTTSITLSFRQQTGTLVVNLLPESRAPFARVLINGVYRFTVNRGQTKTLALPGGIYTVTLEGGRMPQTIRQIVETGKISQIVMNLQ